MAKKEFQAESKKLMDMMINSIYTNKEIFLRELISNASDAIDKLYYKSLTDPSVGMNKGDFRILITRDKENRILTIEDNGIGMTKEELEQNILYDQYGSMDEVISAVRQMTQDAGPVKAVFFCPLVGNIDEGDGDMFTVGDSYLADSEDEINDALKEYTANDENDMAAYYNKDDGVKEKLTSAVWSVELHGDKLFGRIDCSLKEALTAEETEALRDWLTGQCSDGLGEGFEQQPIDTMDGELFVSFWNSGDDYAMMTEDEFEDHLQNTEMTIGGM